MENPGCEAPSIPTNNETGQPSRLSVETERTLGGTAEMDIDGPGSAIPDISDSGNGGSGAAQSVPASSTSGQTQEMSPDPSSATEERNTGNPGTASRTNSTRATQKKKKKKKQPKTAEENDDGTGGKPGAQPNFKGPMNDYLESFMDRYEACRNSPGTGQKGLYRKLWNDIRDGFWELFDWEEVKESFGPRAKGFDKSDMLSAFNMVSLAGRENYVLLIPV